MKSFHLVRKNEGERYDFSSEICVVKLASKANDADICLIEYELGPNFCAKRHYHKKATQVFYILEGEFEFTFDDGPLKISAGDTVTVPPNVWHAAASKEGGRMLCTFRNGRFDEFLERLNGLTEQQMQDSQRMRSLCEEFDTFER